MKEVGVWRADMVVESGDEEGESPGFDQRLFDRGRPARALVSMAMGCAAAGLSVSVLGEDMVRKVAVVVESRRPFSAQSQR